MVGYLCLFSCNILLFFLGSRKIDKYIFSGNSVICPIWGWLDGWVSGFSCGWVGFCLSFSLSLFALSRFLVPSPDWAGVVEGRQFCLEPNWCFFALSKFLRKLESCAIHYGGHWPHVAIQINENCIKWKIPSLFTLTTFQVLICHMWLVAALVNTQVETMSTCWTTDLENETDLTSPSPSLAGRTLSPWANREDGEGWWGPGPEACYQWPCCSTKRPGGLAWAGCLSSCPHWLGYRGVALASCILHPYNLGSQLAGSCALPSSPLPCPFPLAMLGVSTSKNHLTLLSVT